MRNATTIETGTRTASNTAFFHQFSVKPLMRNTNGKVLLIIVLGIAVLFSYSIFFGFLDLRSYLFHPTFPLLAPPSCPPIKIYMYDLPPRFNFAMLYRDFSWTPGEIPIWPSNSGIKRQHSVEYWLMVSLLWRGKGPPVEAVRVSNPNEADAFFVPFFSSLSFNSHGKNMTDPETEKDRLLQVDLMNILHNSKHWQTSNGSDHIIPITHPNAFRFLRDELNSSILIVADFGRYPPTLSNLRKDVVSPYVHIVETYINDDVPDPFSNRTTLLFFRGNTIRKDEGRVRAKLEKILSGHDDVIYERSVPTMEAIQASTVGMRSSKFCLHPAGDTPSSCRLFDAIVSHCVPVIVSDQIELPFEDEIDYSEFALFFSVREAIEPGFMVEQLRRFPKEKWVEMWMKMKMISKHFEFQFPPKREDAVDMLWRQIRHKLPAVHLSTHRKRRLKVPDWWT